MEVSHALDASILANCAVVIASFVQTSTGMGFAMIAAPLLALVSINFVPGPMLFINLFPSVFMLGDGWSFVVKREIAVLAPTILIGTLIGAAILSQIPGDSLSNRLCLSNPAGCRDFGLCQGAGLHIFLRHIALRSRVC